MTLSVGWLLLGVALLVLLPLLPFAALLGRILRLRVCPGGVVLQDPATIPGDYEQIRQHVAPKLEALGFVYAHAQARHSAFEDSPLPHYTWVYRHPREDAHAILGPAMVAGRFGPPYQLEFISVGAHGEVLSTVNGFAHQLLPVLPELRLVDPLSVDLAGQWQAHREVLRDWPARPVTLDPEAFIAHERDFLHRYREALRDQGWLVVDRAGHYRFPPGRALRFAWRLLRGEQRAGRALAGAEDHDMPMPLEAEIDGFRRQQAQQGGGGWLGRSALFVLSVALFAYSFGLRFSWDFVGILMVVLLFHELGHLAGMWCFGYRDLRILFIPFLGAVAMGRDQKARPAQRIVVSLLGPLPGLLLGLALLHWLSPDNSAWLLPWVVMLLVLNYLNLLPIMPLDGGQVVNTALLGRMPRLQLAFVALSALLAGLGAWLLGDPVLWVLVGLLGLGALVMHGRLTLRCSLRERFPRAHTLPGDTLLRGIFQRLREDDCARLPFARKVALAQILSRELGEEPAGPRVAILGLAGYGACLLLPLAWLFVSLGGLSPALMWAGSEPTLPPEAPNFTARLQRTEEPTERWAIHMAAGDWYEGGEDYASALDHYRQALTLAETRFGADDPRLGETHLALGRLSEDPEAARRHLDEALAQWQHALPASDPRLATVLEELAWNSEPVEALSHLRAALRIRQQHPDNTLALADTRSQLASFHQYRDEHEAAVAQYRALSALVENHPGEPMLVSRLSPAVAFFMDRGSLDEARELLLLQHRRLGENDPTQRQVLSTLGWVALLEEDLDRAQAWFEAALALPGQDDAWADMARWERVPVLLDLMVVHGTRGDTARAREYLIQTGEILAETGWMSLEQFMGGGEIRGEGGWQAARRQRWRAVRAAL